MIFPQDSFAGRQMDICGHQISTKLAVAKIYITAIGISTAAISINNESIASITLYYLQSLDTILY